MASHRRNFFALLAGCIFAAALVAGASAINLGTYLKADSVTVPAGESAKAEALFWTSLKENYPVELRVLRSPAGWHVVPVPQKFTVGNESDYNNQKENILLPGTGAPVSARAVSIVISVPGSESEGTYNVALEAVAGGGTGEVALAQARIFNFRVYVKNAANKAADGSSGSGDSNRVVEPDYAAGLPGIAAENPEGQKAKGFGETEVRKALLLLLSAAILYGSWRIYRHR